MLLLFYLFSKSLNGIRVSHIFHQLITRARETGYETRARWDYDIQYMPQIPLEPMSIPTKKKAKTKCIALNFVTFVLEHSNNSSHGTNLSNFQQKFMLLF